MFSVWTSHVHGFAYGDEVSQWLSKFLGKENLYLLNFGSDYESAIKITNLPDTKEAMNAKEIDMVLFQDYTPYMFLSNASVDDLNQRLEKKIQIKNFRPSVAVKDCSPYDEVNIKLILSSLLFI